jgi:hypothetical protein
VAADQFGFATAFAVSAVPTLVALVVMIRTPETMRLDRGRPMAQRKDPSGWQ